MIGQAQLQLRTAECMAGEQKLGRPIIVDWGPPGVGGVPSTPQGTNAQESPMLPDSGLPLVFRVCLTAPTDASSDHDARRLPGPRCGARECFHTRPALFCRPCECGLSGWAPRWGGRFGGSNGCRDAAAPRRGTAHAELLRLGRAAPPWTKISERSPHWGKGTVVMFSTMRDRNGDPAGTVSPVRASTRAMSCASRTIHRARKAHPRGERSVGHRRCPAGLVGHQHVEIAPFARRQALLRAR